MALNDFTLLAKMEALDLEGHKLCQKFNKAERHVLSAEIRHTNAVLLHGIIRAAKSQIHERRFRRPPVETLEWLLRVDVDLEYLKLQVRKAYNLRLINVSAYEQWIRMILEVGGLLGGWLKKLNEVVPRLQEKTGSYAPPVSQGRLF